ncbi:MarR family winged helix-turn-helix transcriptional regulator [Furfurilactobacillus curtus]
MMTDKYDEVEHLWDQIYVTGLHQLTNLFEEPSKAISLSYSEFQLLAAIDIQQGVSLHELAARRQISRSRLSQLMGALLRQQLVEQHVAATDRRIRIFTLTETGRQSLAQLQTTYHHIFAELQLACGPTQLAEMLKTLQQIQNYVAEAQLLRKAED